MRAENGGLFCGSADPHHRTKNPDKGGVGGGEEACSPESMLNEA